MTAVVEARREDGSTVVWVDRKRRLWLLAFVVPALPVLAVVLATRTGLGVFWFWGPIFAFVLVPLADVLTGATTSGSPPGRTRRRRGWARATTATGRARRGLAALGLGDRARPPRRKGARASAPQPGAARVGLLGRGLGRGGGPGRAAGRGRARRAGGRGVLAARGGQLRRALRAAAQKDAHGRYERVTPKHSWNNNHVVTNLLLYQLQRHSDHHENPARRFVALRHVDEAPQLPAGYPAMILLALVPPLWRRVMDPRLVAHYAGDLSRANTR